MPRLWAAPACVGAGACACGRNDTPGAWSEAHFETGLVQSDWQGEWVDPETEEIDIPGMMPSTPLPAPTGSASRRKRSRRQGRSQSRTKPHRPASYLRKTFTAAKGEARLYITAKGLYAVWLNGVRVGDMSFSSRQLYRNKHLAAQTYDVTQYLRDSENELLVALW